MDLLCLMKYFLHLAVPGEVLTKEDDDTNKGEQKYYCKGIGKLLNLAKWSRMEVQNAVCESSRHAWQQDQTGISRQCTKQRHYWCNLQIKD
jgi:hypothetical protein